MRQWCRFGASLLVFTLSACSTSQSSSLPPLGGFDRGEALPGSVVRGRVGSCLDDAARAGWRLDPRTLQAIARRCADVHRDAPALAAAHLRIVAETAFAVGDYASAATAARRWQALPATVRGADDGDDLADLGTLAEQLAAVPPMRRTDNSARFRLAAQKDRAGLKRAAVAFGVSSLTLVVDSGANLSVLSRSTADRLGLVVQGGASIGTSTGARAAAAWTVAPSVRIGDATFTNVPFLVLPDANLSLPLPGGYLIEGIIGFPLLRALGPICFDKAGFQTVAELPAGSGAELRAAGSNIYAALCCKLALAG